nr:hypothetical protein [uncultured Desulfobacter sp.]
MLNVSSLPSLKNIAETILTEGDAGQIILFCIPSIVIWSKWKEYLITALNSKLTEMGRSQIWENHIADAESSNPMKDIAQYIGIDQHAGPEEILTYGNESPIIIELFCEGSLPNAWQNFITTLARFLRISDSQNSNRVVCLFIISPPSYPPIKIDTCIRCYGFWNPLRWEELRLLVVNNFTDKENVMSKAWRTSTYTGASNSDPDIITELSRKGPRSLHEVKKAVLYYQTHTKLHNDNVSIENRFHEELSWDIPPGLTKKWLSGNILGTTLDRGNIIPWQNISVENFEEVFAKAVWREQVAGIYPLLMEITYFASEKISQVKGECWKKYLTTNDGLASETEPGVILSIFRKNSLGTIPVRIFNLLKQVKSVRNKLAHLEPVDYQEVNRIWRLFDQIS